MKQLTIAGIPRNTLFSPNHIGNDAAIFSAVIRLLQEAGFRVNVYTEQEFLISPLQERAVFTMLRSEQAVRRLQRFEDEGGVAINSGRGIENCTRERMTTLLLQHGVPHPDSLIVNVDEAVSVFPSGKIVTSCWVKRGDFHAIHREDVTYVREAKYLKEVMAEYALRNIRKVVINEHLEGDLVKFYGVAGTDFFHWFYPYNQKHSKFGHEAINGKPEGISFSEESLKETCEAVAGMLSLIVYGGDCIVSPDGIVRIIDFNDWPSFAPCRTEASKAIVSAIIKTIQTQRYE
ncbi:hypothetical protein EZS27_007470 [termite gut metagenome]|uniref:Ribosomal protein S6--L-glutamate ligase n=1 Tax=termite gut metagenome TaxID=433724 RepID=A0A5J4SFV9_9ZZZZ